jgi:predicted nicotinamide N-methyase
MSPIRVQSPRRAKFDERELRRRFEVINHPIAIVGRVFELRRPRSADDLVNEDDFNRDERLPYWAEIWPSAYVLAERISREQVSISGGKRSLLELGCGSGLTICAALAVGFEVTAIDYYPEALDFVCWNAVLNVLPAPQTRVVDWRNYPRDLADFDVIVAADVLYERDYCRLIAEAIRQSLAPMGVALVTDPQRSRATLFPDECRNAGLVVTNKRTFGPLSVPGGDPAVRQTVDLFEIRHSEPKPGDSSPQA